MGKSNAAVKNWISVKERFADFTMARYLTEGRW